jgi:hypothetical protein
LGDFENKTFGNAMIAIVNMMQPTDRFQCNCVA